MQEYLASSERVGLVRFLRVRSVVWYGMVVVSPTLVSTVTACCPFFNVNAACFGFMEAGKLYYNL